MLEKNRCASPEINDQLPRYFMADHSMPDVQLWLTGSGQRSFAKQTTQAQSAA
jgi:hypothetical protein